jgi:hypothetical protein
MKLKSTRHLSNLPGKFAKFSEIAGILKKSRRKFRNRWNFKEVIKNFDGLDKKFFEIDEKFLEAFRILNARLRKKRNRWNFFGNAEIFFEIDKKFKVVVKILRSLIRSFGHRREKKDDVKLFRELRKIRARIGMGDVEVGLIYY